MIFNMADGILIPAAMWHDHDIDFPGDYTLQCGMWVWNRDRQFTKWQHPATWYVALGQHAIVFDSPKRPPYWYSTSGLNFDHITAENMSF